MTSRLVSTHLHNFHPLETVTMPLNTPSQLRAVTPAERDLAQMDAKSAFRTSGFFDAN
jgi:hypothetical protein